MSLVLVLDDYQLIELPAIHSVLIFLLAHLPSKMHLVPSTPADPPCRSLACVQGPIDGDPHPGTSLPA